jgi:hypothetical protein
VTDIAKIRAVIKAAKEKAEREKIVNPNQQIIHTSDGGTIISPGPGPRHFKKRKQIDVPGDSWADELVRDRR